MQRYDESYSDYYDSRDPDGYPYGKAVDASSPDTPDGTPIKASFFNDIIGMMQAIQKGASPEGTPITGRPERVSESDVWNALRGFIEREVQRVLKLVPSEATEENQLADKRFVDDAVSTNSAYFLGEFNSVGELPSEGVTNNDYAFVVRTEAGKKYYDRYKYNSRDASWKFEYTLDNTTVPIASESAAGLVKGGGNVTIGEDGTMNVTLDENIAQLGYAYLPGDLLLNWGLYAYGQENSVCTFQRSYRSANDFVAVATKNANGREIATIMAKTASSVTVKGSYWDATNRLMAGSGQPNFVIAIGRGA